MLSSFGNLPFNVQCKWILILFDYIVFFFSYIHLRPSNPPENVFQRRMIESNKINKRRQTIGLIWSSPILQLRTKEMEFYFLLDFFFSFKYSISITVIVNNKYAQIFLKISSNKISSNNSITKTKKEIIKNVHKPIVLKYIYVHMAASSNKSICFCLLFY